jgi:hypothetical protein
LGIKGNRESIAAQLRNDYWVLDPYLRARSFYDRVGIIKPGGAVDYYATGSQEMTANGAASARETSADDVD